MAGKDPRNIRGGTARASFSLSPIHLLTRSLLLTLKNVLSASVATACGRGRGYGHGPDGHGCEKKSGLLLREAMSGRPEVPRLGEIALPSPRGSVQKESAPRFPLACACGRKTGRTLRRECSPLNHRRLRGTGASRSGERAAAAGRSVMAHSCRTMQGERRAALGAAQAQRSSAEKLERTREELGELHRKDHGLFQRCFGRVEARYVVPLQAVQTG